MKKSVNDVIDKYDNKKVKLDISLLEKDIILIQGDSESLRFLGEVMIAIAESNDESIQLSPTGAGKIFFTNSSKLGLYINRRP